MENRSHALIAGVFLLLLGVAALAALMWFGGQHEETNAYVVETHENVTGLNVQAQVRYRGIRVGKVESIRLDPENPRVTLIGISVRQDIPVTRGTVAKLGYQGVTGIAHVLLEDDGKSPEHLPTTSEHGPRIAMQDSLMEELADAGGDALREARDLLIAMNDLLRQENRQAISRTLANLEATSLQTRDATERITQLLTAENMRRIDAILANAEKTTTQAGPFFAEARGLVAGLQETRGRLDAALGDSHSGGVASLAPRLNELTEELASTAHQLNRVLRMIEESPQSLIFGNRNARPGPGESGFSAPATTGSRQ